MVLVYILMVVGSLMAATHNTAADLVVGLILAGTGLFLFLGMKTRLP